MSKKYGLPELTMLLNGLNDMEMKHRNYLYNLTLDCPMNNEVMSKVADKLSLAFDYIDYCNVVVLSAIVSYLFEGDENERYKVITELFLEKNPKVIIELSAVDMARENGYSDSKVLNEMKRIKINSPLYGPIECGKYFRDEDVKPEYDFDLSKYNVDNITTRTKQEMYLIQHRINTRFGKEVKDYDLLLYYTAITLQAHRESLRRILGSYEPFGEAVKPVSREDALLEEIARLKRVHSKEVESLTRQNRKQLDKLNEENDRLRAQVAKTTDNEIELRTLRDKVKSLKSLMNERDNNNSKVEELEQEVQSLRSERSSLYDEIEKLKAQLNVEEPIEVIPLEEKEEMIRDLNVVALGGHQSLIARLRAKFPDWKYLGTDNISSVDARIAKTCDVLVVFADYVSHKMTFKFPDYGQTVEIYNSNLEQIIHQVFDKAYA